MTDPEDPGPSPTSAAASYEVEIINDQTVGFDVPAMTRAIEAGMSHLGLVDQTRLEVSLVGRDRISEMKEDAFGTHAETDVLAYPMDSPGEDAVGPRVLGDLVLCPSVAIGQADAIGVSRDREVLTLLAHGLLHLTGMEHADAVSELQMAKAQEDLAEIMRAGVAA